MLKNYVIKRLQADWSLEQISGRLKKYEYRVIQDTVRSETIYQFVYSKEGRSLRLFVHLRMGKPRRFQIHSRRKKIPIEGLSIHECLPAANKRTEVGHWESDLMEYWKPSGHVSTNYEWTLRGRSEPFPYKLAPGFTYDIRRRVPDSSKAFRYFGWKPRVNLGDGLQEVIKWLRMELG